MNQVIEAIRTRRSVRSMKEEKPPKELIEQVIEAGTWAPNHHLTEPWRFVVISGDERRKLGETMENALRETIKRDEPRRDEILRAEREKTLAAPVIVAVISSPSVGEKVVKQEEVIAMGAAVQNMLLAAHSLGLGAMIRTGRHSYSQPVRSYLDLNERESLAGLVYLGYQAEPPRPTRRSPLDLKVSWRG